MPPEERDHRDHDSDVEHGVDDLGRTPGEKRQQPYLNGVGHDRDDPCGKDPALRLLHLRTLGSANAGGQLTAQAKSVNTIGVFNSSSNVGVQWELRGLFRDPTSPRRNQTTSLGGFGNSVLFPLVVQRFRTRNSAGEIGAFRGLRSKRAEPREPLGKKLL